MPSKGKRRAGPPPGRKTAILEDIVVPEVPVAPDVVPNGVAVNGAAHIAEIAETGAMAAEHREVVDQVLAEQPAGPTPEALFVEAQSATGRYEVMEAMRDARIRWMDQVRPTYQQYEREVDALTLALTLTGNHIENVGRLARGGA